MLTTNAVKMDTGWPMAHPTALPAVMPRYLTIFFIPPRFRLPPTPQSTVAGGRRAAGNPPLSYRITRPPVRSSRTNRPRAGMRTRTSDPASMTAPDPTISLRYRIHAMTA